MSRTHLSLSVCAFALFLSCAAAACFSQNPAPLTPNGIKAGVTGGWAYPFVAAHVGWWYDWTPVPTSSASGPAVPVPMLWGDGQTGPQDAQRLAQFKALNYTPAYILSYEEPDCSPPWSSGVPVDTGAQLWNELFVPLGQKGSLLGSPSMCKQADESGWLQPFKQQIQNNCWDFTAIHINKNNMTGVNEDLNHYWNTYGLPIWVTEFACVDDHNGFNPCTDQGQINQYIMDIVDLFEGDSRVYAYAYSNGGGLGNVWPMTNDQGQLTESGQTYLAAISKYH
eukprot:Phypoly_transcript_15238.p1 GENE.Phypoly_transcript_15238~~Phypoly_transcript_15238.p1  ORF type:complete len:281 (-),score=43.53 Phypoly_transcript_15238:52-894(-)